MASACRILLGLVESVQADKSFSRKRRGACQRGIVVGRMGFHYGQEMLEAFL